MTTTYHTAATKVREILVSQGFTQTNRTPRGTHGHMSVLHSEWANGAGRKARVSAALLSKTGQSSRGAAAAWGYALTVA